MPARPEGAFQYAVLRIVPDVDRGERLNAGVVLFARTLDFLGARVGLDERRLLALWPDADAAAVARHLDGLARVAAGDPAGGPIAALPPSQRFHWLVSPSSTVVQPSEVHTGLCDDPRAALDRLYERLVGQAPGHAEPGLLERLDLRGDLMLLIGAHNALQGLAAIFSPASWPSSPLAVPWDEAQADLSGTVSGS